MSQSAVQKDEISAEQPSTHPPSIAFGKALNTIQRCLQVKSRKDYQKNQLSNFEESPSFDPASQEP